MKNRNIIKPTGLKGKEVINRMKELMGSTSINEDVKGSVVELTKEGPDGKVYAIIRENHEYYIKVSENKSNLVTEDFNYIGGLQNKKDKAYPSYAKAIKQLNLKFMSLNEAIGKSGQVNVFEDDNLLTEHHPLKADMKLSADKGIGDGAEYVVDKKGAELKYDSKEGKEDDGFGDNVADSTAEKDIEEVKLNENETAIDEMIDGGSTWKSGDGVGFPGGHVFVRQVVDGKAGKVRMMTPNSEVVDIESWVFELIRKVGKDNKHWVMADTEGNRFVITTNELNRAGDNLGNSWDEAGIDEMITGEAHHRDDKSDRYWHVVDSIKQYEKAIENEFNSERIEDYQNEINKLKAELVTLKEERNSIEEEVSKKGFSIARAIQEMDEVIDSLATEDDKVDEILESLGEDERAIMMEALKKKD
jgi:hypothetical protein